MVCISSYSIAYFISVPLHQFGGYEIEWLII